MNKLGRGLLACFLSLSAVAGCAPAAPNAGMQQVEATRAVENVVAKQVAVELPAQEQAPDAKTPVKAVLEVLSPVGQADPNPVSYAKRLDTLNGKTIALHWNGKPGGEYLLYEIKDRLAARYHSIKFVEWPKGTAWAEDVKDYMRALPADAAILSVGD